MFYNRLPAYFAALFVSFLLGFYRILDLEDGEVLDCSGCIFGNGLLLTRKIFDLMCSSGSLLANSFLENMTTIRPTLCYYGCVLPSLTKVDWHSDQLKILFGGTISEKTGSLLLQDAIRHMRSSKDKWTKNITIEITGAGDSIKDFAKLADAPGFPHIILHERLTGAQYTEIASGCHVGLALKPNGGPLANTTFPSKVIELAALGLLVVTTDISDVKKVLTNNGAIYLDKDNPKELIKILKWIESNRPESSTIANAGKNLVLEKCSQEAIKNTLVKFLFFNNK
jgi:glycosyltransferase involved in cell wall biosynthesis